MAGPLVLGVDPDTKTTAWAMASLDRVHAVGVVRGGLRELVVGFEDILCHHQPELAVIEGQEIYAGSKTRPNDVLKLTLFAGMVGGIVGCHSTALVQFPLPKDWKGQVPKEIHQARVLTHYGIFYQISGGRDRYCVPSGCAKVAAIRGAGNLNPGDWKHVSDAVGLALHGARLLNACPPTA